jgi:hypothetical protein
MGCAALIVVHIALQQLEQHVRAPWQHVHKAISRIRDGLRGGSGDFLVCQDAPAAKGCGEYAYRTRPSAELNRRRPRFEIERFCVAEKMVAQARCHGVDGPTDH